MKPYATISLTSACNVHCAYCPPQGENYKTPEATFGLENVCEVIRIVRSLGVSKVRFTGGEPFLYPYLREAVEYASEVGLEVHINTNGLLFGQNLWWLRNIPHVLMKVSLDALSDSVMQRISGVGQVSRILHGIKEGVKAGLVQRINVVLTKLNFSQIPNLLALCKSLKIGLKIFDMFFVPETEAAWRSLYIPPEALHLDGTPSAPYIYTSKYGIPVTELVVDGVPVRIKDSQNGSHYHQVCEACPSFPCQEGLYCLVVTPSMTVVPCRLGQHLFRRCNNSLEVADAISQVISLYDQSRLQNLFWARHTDFYSSALESAKSLT